MRRVTSCQMHGTPRKRSGHGSWGLVVPGQGYDASSATWPSG